MKESNEERVLREKIQGIFSKTLQETPKTPMSGGVFCHDYTLINLHNLRLIYDFKLTETERQTLHSYIKPDQAKSWGDTTFKLINYGKVIQVKNFMDCNLQIKKNTIEVRYLKATDQWHLIEHGEKGANKFIQLILQPNNEAKYLLKEFMARYGGKSRLQLLNTYHHSKGMDDNIISKIPRPMTFHNKTVQKVYKEKNVEWHNTTAVLNHLTNLGVIELTPTIADSIDNLSQNIEILQQLHPYQYLKMFTQSPHEVINNGEYLQLMQKLTEHERLELWDYWLQCVYDGVIDGCTGRRLE